MENTENNMENGVEVKNDMPKKSSQLSLPVAIVVAGVLIAGAIFITKMPPAQQAPVGQEVQSGYKLDKLAPVSSDEHIFGAAASTKIYIVEFSDTECPFCKVFHPTMKKIVENYKGKVAWAYRHFPLDSIHPKTRKEAEATECANELGGNDAFWKYLDRIFEITPANNGMDPAELYNIAQYVGLNQEAFRTCLDSGRYADKVEAQSQDGMNTGVQGTPASFIVYGKQIIPIEGAQPYEAIKAKIDALLK
jgi:protein-disulfide isomerase